MRKVALIIVGLTVIALLATVWVAVDARGDDLPEYVDVRFTSIADLDVRTDSVLAVCDTTIPRSDSCLEGYSIYYFSPFDTLEYFYYKYEITPRRFAGREIWWMPDSIETEILPYPPGGSLWDVYPGKARIWYEERRK